MARKIIKKATKKTTKNKKATPKKPAQLTQVRISKNVKESLVREFDSYRRSTMYDDGEPLVLLLGEDKRGTVKEYERLLSARGGCSEMPSIRAEEISHAYIRLAKRGYTGCAIARLGTDFENYNLWGYDSGVAIYMKNMKYILTYDGYAFRAATARDKNFEFPGGDEYDYDEDIDNSYENIKELKVIVGK
jgi:hypothetical protein